MVDIILANVKNVKIILPSQDQITMKLKDTMSARAL